MADTQVLATAAPLPHVPTSSKTDGWREKLGEKQLPVRARLLTHRHTHMHRQYSTDASDTF